MVATRNRCKTLCHRPPVMAVILISIGNKVFFLQMFPSVVAVLIVAIRGLFTCSAGCAVVYTGAAVLGYFLKGARGMIAHGRLTG